ARDAARDLHRLDKAEQGIAVAEIGFPARRVAVGCNRGRAHQASHSTFLPSAWARRLQRALAWASIWLLAVSTLQPPRPTCGSATTRQPPLSSSSARAARTISMSS